MNTQSLLNSTQTAILITNNEGNILWANTSSEQLFAHSLVFLKQFNIKDILQTTDQFSSNNTLESTHSPSVNQDSNTEESIQPISSHDQWIVGIQTPLFVDYCISLIDVIEENERHSMGLENNQLSDQVFLIEIWSKGRHHRISQEQSTQQQYNLARNLIRSVAHEVKNPLTGIRGAGQLLQKIFLQNAGSLHSDATTTKVNTYTDLIISETDRLSHLINQLLGIKRPLNKMKINIHRPIEHVLTLNTNLLFNIDIERDYDISLPDITADNEQMIQVFLNLINNAIEAIEEKKSYDERTMVKEDKETKKNNPDDNYYPKLTLQTRVEFSRTIDKVLHKKVAKISIIDNGIGIKKDFIEQIFFPLVTGRAEGTGLGLAVVRDIIQQHQGHIEASSEKGKTTFSLYLPFESSAS